MNESVHLGDKTVQKERIATSKHLKSVPPAQMETKRTATADPQEGARLIRAFLKIEDPKVRDAIIGFVERLQTPSPLD